MRNTFAKTMTDLAQEREDICLLSGDIGNRMFDRFKEAAPKRFFNCGIAEGNMMSMAAGMALSGLRPVVYTITPFITTRCLEQIRTGVAYHEAPVIIVGTGSGLSYAELGATHHSLEDVAILRSIPNLQICAPADPLELAAQLREAILSNKPTYIRIGKKGEPNLFTEKTKLGLGKAQMLRRGTGKFLIIGMGPILNEAIKATDILNAKDISISLASMSSIKPLDTKFLESMLLNGYTDWISLEEHHKMGGLGTTLLEWLSEKQISTIRLHRIGIDDHFIHKLGSQCYVREKENLDARSITELIEQL